MINKKELERLRDNPTDGEIEAMAAAICNALFTHSRPWSHDFARAARRALFDKLLEEE